MLPTLASMLSPSTSSLSRRRVTPSSALLLAVVCASSLSGSHAQKAGTFEQIGNSGVSAQQLFLGALNKVYIVDKTENNPMRVNGEGGEHAAWASEYSLVTNEARAMDVVTNSFCAGGTVLGDGTWLNVGGNQGVTWGGLTAPSQTGGAPYDDLDGGKAVRFLTPCNDDDKCEWTDDPDKYMSSRRWYPTLETLEDGTAIIIGGCSWGGYVNDASQNNPTYEFYPSRGAPITLGLLQTTLPANLYTLTWLLPSGNLFLQTNWATAVLDYKTNVQYNLPDVPLAVRTYPASAATAMLPLTPANNWQPTMLMCGGSNLRSDQWVTNWNIAAYPADNSCVKISPEQDTTWVEEDSLDTGRTMGQFIILPDGRLWMGNGGALGTAGYGNESWAVGRSYCDRPLHDSWYFDPLAASGKRWTKAGTSKVDRLYHSSATLLPDGSVLVSGSNPNPDYVDRSIDPTITYVTEYRVEKFYPSYYDKTRPEPTGMPSKLGYGGAYFNVSLPSSAFSSSSDFANTKFVVSRTGFSTHAMNMGMRHLELDVTYTGAEDGSATFHVSQIPPQAAIFPPGPALMFCVVNGVPSQAIMVTVGSGKIETQKTTDPAPLPANFMATPPASETKAGDTSQPTSAQSSSGSGGSSTTQASSAAKGVVSLGWVASTLALGSLAVVLVC